MERIGIINKNSDIKFLNKSIYSTLKVPQKNPVTTLTLTNYVGHPEELNGHWFSKLHAPVLYCHVMPIPT